MRILRYLLLILAIYFVFVGGSSRYLLSYQVRVAHHIIVTLLLTIWLMDRIRSKKGIPTTSLNLPLFALIGIWGISAVTSLDPRMAFEHVWFPFTFILFFFVIVDYFQRGRSKLIMEVFFFVVVIVILLTGLEYVSWYWGLGILPNSSIPWAQLDVSPQSIPPASLAMSISTLVAGFTAPCLFITATWAMTVRKNAYKRILWILSFGLLITLLLTFSRGGLLAFIAGIATFTLIRLIQNPRIVNTISPKLIGGIGGIVTLLILGGFVLLTLPYAIGRSDQGRLDMWRSAVEMTIDHPITGVGPGLFGRAYRDYRDPVPGRDKLASAHNLYLNTASELGILGIIVGASLAMILVRSSYETWKAAQGRNQHLRVEGMFVALVALAVHSSVDVFTITPINLVFILIVSYLLTGHRSILDTRPTGQVLPAYILLGITILFGFALIQWDRAQGIYQSSFSVLTQDAVNLAQDAQSIDPNLNLYHLYEAFLLGKNASSDDDLVTAINAYQRALKREPTWDIGWINLAYLEYINRDTEQALKHLEEARIISPNNSAPFAYAKIGDGTGFLDDDAIIRGYKRGLNLNNAYGLPLSEIWWATELSIQATEEYLAQQDVERQYRVYREYRPEYATTLVSDNPTSAQEWWIVGTHQLSKGILNDAYESFSEAIRLSPDNGDYYVARAETQLDNPAKALSDLQFAKIYGTHYEFPNEVQARITISDEEKRRLWATALPIRSMRQDFASVLYTRPAIFDIYPMMRLPGLGGNDLQSWYAIAETQMRKGNRENAIRTYEFILDQAPYETRAQEKLRELRVNP